MTKIIETRFFLKSSKHWTWLDTPKSHSSSWLNIVPSLKTLRQPRLPTKEQINLKPTMKRVQVLQSLSMIVSKFEKDFLKVQKVFFVSYL